MHALGVQANNRRAVLYCEGQLGQPQGTIANSLVVFSPYFDIRGVIDSQYQHQSADMVIEHGQTIPIFGSLGEALAKTDDVDWLIYGKTFTDNRLPADEYELIQRALACHLKVVSGLLQFLSHYAEFADYNAQGLIYDLCRPPPVSEQRAFTGAVEKVPARRILVLGTGMDHLVHTTAYRLYRALQQSDLNCAMVTTTRTGLLQGIPYGFCPDAWSLVGAEGSVEEQVIRCWNHQRPDVILIEAPTSVSCPGRQSGIAVLRGCRPHGVIMVDAPSQPTFTPAAGVKPDLHYELALIQHLVNVKLLGFALYQQASGDGETSIVRNDLAQEYGVPIVDPVQEGLQPLVDCIRLIL